MSLFLTLKAFQPIVEFLRTVTKALNALDGTIFMGRILHLLPGKERDKPAFANQPRIDKSANTSYKKEKLAKMKENATTGI